MSLPIVIIHQGDSFYLADTIAQARQACGSEKPILLGDDGNRHYRGTRFFPYAAYFDEAAAFAGVYKHYNCAAHQYDWLLFCFQKWIFLRRFMEREGIERCFVIDSDVLVYMPPERLAATYGNAELTVCLPDKNLLAASGHATYVSGTRILGDLADLMREMFGETDLNRRIREASDEGRSTTHGITEMAALALLLERFPDRVLNNFAPISGLAVDHSMLSADGFQMHRGMKRLRWQDHIPHGLYAPERSDPVWVPFGAVHFQGHAKKRMLRSVSLRDPRLIAEWLANKARFRVRKWHRKLTRAK